MRILPYLKRALVGSMLLGAVITNAQAIECGHLTGNDPDAPVWVKGPVNGQCIAGYAQDTEGAGDVDFDKKFPGSINLPAGTPIKMVIHTRHTGTLLAMTGQLNGKTILSIPANQSSNKTLTANLTAGAPPTTYNFEISGHHPESGGYGKAYGYIQYPDLKLPELALSKGWIKQTGDYLGVTLTNNGTGNANNIHLDAQFTGNLNSKIALCQGSCTPPKESLPVCTNTLSPNHSCLIWFHYLNSTGVRETGATTLTVGADKQSAIKQSYALSYPNPLLSGYTTTYSYDDGKDAVSKTSPLKNKVTNRYRSFGRPSHDQLMQIMLPNGVPIDITRNEIGETQDIVQKGLHHSFHYDTHHFITQSTIPETGQGQYGRDVIGQQTSIQVGTSGTTRFDYDANGNLTTTTYPDGQTIQKGYDANNRISDVTSDNGKIKWHYTYTPNGLIQSETLTLEGRTYQITYGYNGNDHLSSISYPDGTTINYAPDAFGRATQALPFVTKASFLADGKLGSYTTANDLQVIHEENANDQIAHIEATHLSTPVLNRSYIYNANGDLQKITDLMGANSQSFDYDQNDRLIKANGPWGTGTIGYDHNGNITNLTAGAASTQYSYDASNKLTTTTGTYAFRYGYNPYRDVTSDGKTTYSYNDASELIKAKGTYQKAPFSIHYTYDGNGHIVKTTVNSDKPIINIYTLGGQKILEIDPNNNKQTDYIYLAGNLVAKSTHPIGQAASTTTASYYVGDIMGSPAIEVAQDGSISWQQVYLPFGREQSPSTQNPTSHPSYIGKPFSAYTGLSYLNARFYNPAIGRFYSVDPQGIDPHSPKSINRYEYANNNPYTYIDPTGLGADMGSANNNMGGLAGNTNDHDGSISKATAQAASQIVHEVGDKFHKGFVHALKTAALVGLSITPIGEEAIASRVAEEGVALTGNVAKTISRLSTKDSKPGGLIIGKIADVGDVSKLRNGDYTLNLPNKGTPKANWKQNYTQLRYHMRNKQPIRDVTGWNSKTNTFSGDTGFLRAERSTLQHRGWSFDKNTNTWNY